MSKLEISSEKEEEHLRVMRTALKSVLAESKVSSNSVSAAVSGTSSAEPNSSDSGYFTTRRSVVFLQKGRLRSSVPTGSLSGLSSPTESTEDSLLNVRPSASSSSVAESSSTTAGVLASAVLETSKKSRQC